MLKLELTNMQVANEKYVSDVKIGIRSFEIP